MLAIIDGDVIAHLSCKSRFNKPALPGQLYTELVAMVADKHSHQFSKEEDRQYLEDSWNNFQKGLEEILEAVFAEEYLMAVKSALNYRSDLYPDYKMNRHKDPSKMNAFVPVIRKLAIHEGLAIEAVGREADDMLRMWAEQARAAGIPYVIVSIDKDLDCIPGKHYHIKKKILYEVSPMEATRFFYQQLLSGDPTDNIPGVMGIGPVKAEKFLYNTHTEEEMQEVVVETYMSVYETDWHDMLLSNGKMLYLQKHAEDYFTLQEWPVVQALLGDYLNAKKSAGKLITEAAEIKEAPTSPAESIDVPPWEDAPPVSRVAAGATIAPSPIPRPSPSPSPSLGPKNPLPEPVAKIPSISTACAPKPFKGSVFAGKVPIRNNG